MSLKWVHSIDLPEHIAPGGFDHAAIHQASQRVYVAHAANNALDVIDCENERYLRSISGLTGVAGVLVSAEREMMFTSNRGEDTIGIFCPENEAGLFKVAVGVRPNGLSFDPDSGCLLVANVGNPEIPGSFTLSTVDIHTRAMVASIPVPGRTRWTVFNPLEKEFYINIAEPAQFAVVKAGQPDRIARTMEVPAAGPHGLDLDQATGRLFCACDEGKLVALEPATGKVLAAAGLSGKPDVIFFHPFLKRLYIAIGDPGVIDIFDTDNLDKLETVVTEVGAHTIALDDMRNKVYAFLPQTHRAAVFVDE